MVDRQSATSSGGRWLTAMRRLSFLQGQAGQNSISSDGFLCRSGCRRRSLSGLRIPQSARTIVTLCSSKDGFPGIIRCRRPAVPYEDDNRSNRK